MKAPARMLSLRILLVSLMASAALAETWIVEFDPDNPENLIGTVVERAASSDTILVGPGTYFEHIPVDGKTLTFIGTGGPEQTILDGGRAFEGRLGTILYNAAPGPDSLFVEAFTFRNGKGVAEGYENAAGAIRWHTQGSSLVRVENCIFEFNESDPWGAGAVELSVARSEFRECRFVGNGTLDGGRDINFAGGHLVVTDSHFELGKNRVWALGPHVYVAGHSLNLRRSRFVNNSDQSGIALLVGTLDCTVTDNVFEDHGALLATNIGFGPHPGEIEPQHYDVEFSRNLVWNDADPSHDQDASVSFGYSRSSLVVEHNTFIRSPVTWGYGGGGIAFRNNVLYESPAFFRSNYGGDISCNVAYPDTIICAGCSFYYYEGNVFSDPLFCDAAAGDFSVAEEGPCSPSSSAAGCGGIGLFDAACTLTRTQRMTWGRIKSLYLEKRLTR